MYRDDELLYSLQLSLGINYVTDTITTDSFLWNPLQLVRFNDKALNQFYANEGVCCVVSKEEFTTSEVQRILELYEQNKNSIHAIDTIVKKNRTR